MQMKDAIVYLLILIIIFSFLLESNIKLLSKSLTVVVRTDCNENTTTTFNYSAGLFVDDIR